MKLQLPAPFHCLPPKPHFWWPCSQASTSIHFSPQINLIIYGMISKSLCHYHSQAKCLDHHSGTVDMGVVPVRISIPYAEQWQQSLLSTASISTQSLYHPQGCSEDYQTLTFSACRTWETACTLECWLAKILLLRLPGEHL